MSGEPGHGTDRRGLVFNIQKFSLHDGSGIRTLVFLQGCPLACRWCSNPEGQARSPELAFDAGRCIGRVECDRCAPECPAEAIGPSEDGKVQIDRELCDDCGECVDACPSKALELLGRSTSVGEVLEAVEEDSGFNDAPEDVGAIARLVGDLPGDRRHELLPYHGFGEPKYRRLGKDYPLRDLAAPTEKQMARLREVAGAD